MVVEVRPELIQLHIPSRLAPHPRADVDRISEYTIGFGRHAGAVGGPADYDRIDAETV
jgi:hypothetical protein